jgi:hypothetical protein
MHVEENPGQRYPIYFLLQTCMDGLGKVEQVCPLSILFLHDSGL